ncbi:MAG: D-alanine--D-alanine ligase [Pseudomonadota bacterium]
MKRKITVGILCGGKSAEHEVSLQSAGSIISAIDGKKYRAVIIGIDKKGHWHLFEKRKFLVNAADPERIALGKPAGRVTLVPGAREGQGRLVFLSGGNKRRPITLDVVFPVLHGPFGEDGTVQGQLAMASIPFVGAGVFGSAAGMDKDVMKRLLRDAGIPIADFFVFYRWAADEISFGKVRRRLGLPLFIKPANLGSSVGISKAATKKQFEAAVKEAFRYDDKIIVEEFIDGREIECSVLGNEKPAASVPGEIIPIHEFYSYEAKYLDRQGARLDVPAKLSASVVRKVKKVAIATYRALGCEGMSRVDMFLRGGSEVLVNEVNTIPGFTGISMYPKLWEASGLAYPKLIDRLIRLALDRFRRRQRLKTTFG